MCWQKWHAKYGGLQELHEMHILVDRHIFTLPYRSAVSIFGHEQKPYHGLWKVSFVPKPAIKRRESTLFPGSI
jgi:hypothetical protein